MIYCINYADEKFRQQQKYNTRTAYAKGKADKVIEYSPIDIDDVFKTKNKTIFANSRGDGLWLWKPYIINKTLQIIEDNDYLFYCDAGSVYIDKIQYLIDCMEEQKLSVMLFELPLLARQFTKKEAFFLMEYKNYDQNQILAGYILLKKCDYSKKIISEWLEACTEEKILSPNKFLQEIEEFDDFVAHREDQSVLNIIARKNNLPVFRDPSDKGARPWEYASKNWSYVPKIYQNSNYPTIILGNRKENPILYKYKVRIKNILNKIGFYTQNRHFKRYGIDYKNIKTILIYDHLLTGHHMEYIHNLYMEAIKYDNINFIFAIPKEFRILKDKMAWAKSNNIFFHFINQNKNQTGYWGNIMQIKHLTNKYSIDHVFFIHLMSYMPLIAFTLKKNIKISGIVYFIYLYRWKESNYIIKIKDILRYYLFARSKRIKEIFLLNDNIAPIYLDRKYHVNKFRWLPDPFPPLAIVQEDMSSLRFKYQIPHKNLVFLHFGGLSFRKGTLEILNAIEILNDNELKDLTFIFAGRVYNDIRNEFYEKVNEQKKRVQLLCFDEFCEYSLLANLSNLSNFIILPYYNTGQSSGVIGYGAQFNTPVIVPNNKLLGKIVRKYKLGFLLKDNSAREIVNFIRTESKNKLIKTNNNSYYLDINSVENFNRTIFDSFIK